MAEQPTPNPTFPAYGGDRVETVGNAIWIICRAPKGWTPRRGRAETSSEFPGTAVRWETELFEVVDALSLPDGTIRYRLETWPDRHTVRSIQMYDAASESARVGARAGHRKSVARRRLAILLSPVLGHLPGAVQDRMESEFGAPAVAMTVISALPLFAVGFTSFIFTLAVSFGSGYSRGVSGLENLKGSIPALLPLPLAVYLVVESGLRLGAAFVLQKPYGSLPGTLLYEIWRIAMGRPPVSPSTYRGAPASPEQNLQDRFRMLEIFLSLLSPEEQELFERRFGMETLRWGKVTALLLLAVGGLNVIASLGTVASGAVGVGDVVWLVAGAALSAEQILRLRQIGRGRPAGSVLGALVRPLARPLLVSGRPE